MGVEARTSEAGGGPLARASACQDSLAAVRESVDWRPPLTDPLCRERDAHTIPFRGENVSPVSLAGFHSPGARSVTGHGCGRPKPVRNPMGIRIAVPPGATPIAAVDAIMQLFGRENVELAIEALIDRLDEMDGDADLEPTGDEQDGNGAEDDGGACRPQGPGCPIADSDVAAWAERPEGGLTLQTHGEEDDEADEPEMRRAHTRYIRADLRRRGRA